MEKDQLGPEGQVVSPKDQKRCMGQENCVEDEYYISPSGKVSVYLRRVKRRGILALLLRDYRTELKNDGETVPSEFEELICELRGEEGSAAVLLSGRRQQLIARRVFAVIVFLLKALPTGSDDDLPNRTLLVRPKETSPVRPKEIFRSLTKLLGWQWETPPERCISNAVRFGQRELEEIKELVKRLARRSALSLYLFGLIPGVIFSLVLAFGVYRLIPIIHAKMLTICLVAGAVGAIMSVLTRIANEQKLDIDTEQGQFLTLLAGSFRPIVGAIVGVVIFILVQASLLPLGSSRAGGENFFFASLAFLAGFSERWAQDTIVSGTPGIGFRRREKIVSGEEDETAR